jgi:hypothetical protein
VIPGWVALNADPQFASVAIDALAFGTLSQQHVLNAS